MEINQIILASQQIQEIINQFNGLKKTGNKGTFQFTQKNWDSFVELKGKIIKIESLKEKFNFFKSNSKGDLLNHQIAIYYSANQINNPNYDSNITDKDDSKSKEKIFNPDAKSRKSVTVDNKEFNDAINEFVTALEEEKNKAVEKEKIMAQLAEASSDEEDQEVGKNSMVVIEEKDVPSKEEIERQLTVIKTTWTQALNNAFLAVTSAAAGAATITYNNIPSFDSIFNNIDFTKKLLDGTATTEEIENQFGETIQGFFNGLDKTTGAITTAKNTLINGFNALRSNDATTPKDNSYATQPLSGQVIDALVGLVNKVAEAAAPVINNAVSAAASAGTALADVTNYAPNLFSTTDEPITLDLLIQTLESGLTASGEKNIGMNYVQIKRLIQYLKKLGGLDDNSDLIKNLNGL